ncbi:MAG: PEGA domain-containing protein [Treponema sp.]|jgi:hypothetical protein|nr:PEGA domain-containing protein [Treponema sp.]
MRIPGSGLFFLPILAVFSLCAPSLAAQSPLSIKGDRIESVSGRGLRVRTKPAGALVYIDNIERGKTPLDLRDLRDGEYWIRVSKSGYGERELRVRVSGGSRLELDLELEELTGRLVVTIRREGVTGRPFNPELLIDGAPPREDRDKPGGPLLEAVSLSPSLLSYHLQLPIGRRRVLVRAFGWEDAQGAPVVESGKVAVLELTAEPAVFLLSGGRVNRPRFNPGNAGALGSAELAFLVSAPGSGSLSVFDEEDRLVYSRPLPDFAAWSQQAAWDGRDQRGEVLGDGTYTLRIDARPSGSPASGLSPSQSVSAQVRIDSSLLIYPLSLSAALPGLFYAPSPALLPPRSFQLESALLFGQVSALSGNSFKGTGVPAELGFRFSPLQDLELAAALGTAFGGGGEGLWGFSLSAKWLFLKPNMVGQPNHVGQPREAGQPALPLSLALLGSFSWAENPERSPQREGLSLILPLCWDFGRGLSLIFSPGLFWPELKQGEPRLLLSLGPLYRRGMFSAGLSLRSELDFSGDGDSAPLSLFSAAELKFHPSNLVFTLLGGLWNRGTETGAFGGFSLGMIF